MSPQANSWLPRCSLTSALTAEPFARLLESWVTEWFCRARWSVAGTWQPALDQDTQDWSVLRSGSSFTLHGRERTIQKVAAEAIGVDPEETYTQHDLHLLRSIAEKALDALATMLENFVGERQAPRIGYFGTDKGQLDDRFWLELGPEGKPLLAIGIDAAQLARIGRSGFRPTGQAETLEPAKTALDDLGLSVSAQVGLSRLTLEQISTLQIGDVLVLDREIGQTIGLEIEGRLTKLPFMLRERNGKICLEFKENE